MTMERYQIPEEVDSFIPNKMIKLYKTILSTIIQRHALILYTNESIYKRLKNKKTELENRDTEKYIFSKHLIILDEICYLLYS